MIQKYNLNLVPLSNTVFVRCSQYDKESRTIEMTIYNGNALYTIPEGSVVTVRGTKQSDNTGFEYPCSFIGSIVSFDVQEQMTVFAEKVPAEIRITKEGTILGSANFFFLIEPSPLSENTVISETQLPLLETALANADKAEEYAGYAQGYATSANDSADSAEADALKSEGYANGKQNGEDVSEGEYFENNAKYYSEQASQSATNAATSERNASGYESSASGYATTASNKADEAEASALKSEGFAVGEQNGVAVSTGTYYHNNAEYYAQEAEGSASTASTKASEANTDALKAEGYAVGKQNGTDVSSGTYYHNNAGYYAGEASSSASTANTKATESNTNALKAEGYAVGKQNGTDVSSGTYFQNNAKYYSDLTAQMYSNIADVYDSAKTYNLGDRVLYNGILYKSISAITTAEAWNGAHWQVCKVFEYDDLLNVIKIVDSDITMGDVSVMLDAVNGAGDHVIFDVASLNAGMYLCTIYIGAGYYRIADLVTGFEGTGFFSASDKLADIISSGSKSTGKHYTVQWDMANAQCVRLNDASSITTVTTNFKHSGSVNDNYDNPFDDIYPWSGRKLCNIDVDTYRSLSAEDDITDCVTAWEDDDNFSYDDQYGVWVYTPPFFGRSYTLGNYRYFDVTDENTLNNIAYPAMITGRWHGADVTLTIGGTSKHCNLPVKGMPMANVTLQNQHSYANNYGASLVDIYKLDASALLYIVEFANMNSQNSVGSGVSDMYVQSLRISANVTNSNTITLTASNARAIVGAIIDIGTSDGGFDIARSYITSVSGATLTLADPVTATTAHYVSIHGMINIEDSEIGSKSGYIGTNGRSHAYYRGEVLWGNKWQYILGAYRQTGGKLWIAEEGDTDNYDAVNTSAHIDTGLTLPAVNADWYYEENLGLCEGLSAPPFISETGGNSSNPVGDASYIPLSTAGNTVCVSGGPSSDGTRAGLFCVAWNRTASYSHWSHGPRPSLINP